MRTALDVIEDIRATGAEVYAHPERDSILLVGYVPHNLLDELNRRHDDVMAMFREHQAALSTITDEATRQLFAGLRRKRRPLVRAQ